MKKTLLIATSAIVASAGIAHADITITGSANAGYYSGLSKKRWYSTSSCYRFCI